MIKHIIDVVKGKHPFKSKRSRKWPDVRRQHLDKHPTCEVCNGNTSLEVHHKEPFHVRPDLELDLKNLITLCSAKKNGVDCHLVYGHLGDYRSINKDVVVDSAVWNRKFKNRKPAKEAYPVKQEDNKVIK